MLKFLAAAAALSVAAAPLAAHAEKIQYVDLRGLNLASPADFKKAELRLEAAADAFCGRVGMPQPIELASHAVRCQAGFIAKGEDAVRAARAKQIAGKPAPSILALR